jgi:energy-coupling factor transporter ATP-binding protein EcfA2
MADTVQRQPPALEVRGFSCRYPDSERWVLQDLDFVVRRGETLLILGPSGCGKSTLALSLKGLIPHAIEAEVRGTILVEGGAITQEPPGGETLCRIGLVFQDPETQVVMPRVDEEVAFGLENMCVPTDGMGPRIAAALQEVGLEEQQTRNSDTLSRGQMQRLALGAVLAMDPSILVLDEPTANLDPAGRSHFFTTLARLKEERRATIVLIEHHIDLALPLVDRVLAVDRSGKIIAHGKPRSVFGNHASRLEEQGIWLPAAVRIAQQLRGRGLPVHGCPLFLEESEKAFVAVLKQGAGLRREDPPVAPNRSRGEAPAGTGDAGGGAAAAATRMKAVEMQRVAYAYPEGTQALREVTLEVDHGGLLALVGANGSGKSTLARLLCGLLRPQAGSISLLGRDIRTMTGSRLVQTIGYVFQNPEHQFVTEKVSDELAYSLKRHVAQEQVGERIEALIRTFALGGYEEANPFSLSQGEKRRLSVATMIALDQPILILDEPTFGQDMASARALMELVERLNERGTTIILITHDMSLVLDYAQAVAVMNHGRLLFRGSPAELFCSEEILESAGLAAPFELCLGRRLRDPLMFKGIGRCT